MSNIFCIEARAFYIPYTKWLPAIASHNFLVLKKNQQIISQLHGLATSRKTGEIVPIGYYERWHSLNAYEIRNDSYLITQPQATKILCSGDSMQVLPRWQSAVNILPLINQTDLNYPAFGINVFRKTINSNSVYRTLTTIMALVSHRFPRIFQPGLNQYVLPLSVIEQLRYIAK